MRYLYGDSVPFPPQYDFLAALEVFCAQAARVVRLDAESRALRVAAEAGSLAPGAALTLGIRPEHLLAHGEDPGQALAGRVQVAEHLGDITYLYLHPAGGTEALTVKTHPDNPLRSGDEAFLSFPAQHCYLFDPSGRTLPATKA